MEELEGIAVSASLLLRIFEHIHETPELEDYDLHSIVEIMNYMSMEAEGPLDIEDYDKIIGNEENEEDLDDVFESFLEEKMKNDPCWDNYEMIGQKEKNGRKVPNCVPVKEETEAGIYSLMGKGNFGPAHPLHDPRVTVYVNGQAKHTASSGKEGHLWALERGHRLPDDHHLHGKDSYESLKAEIRHRK